jgi:hypothetical protein
MAGKGVADFVMVLGGSEVAEDATVEACGLHNNASIEVKPLASPSLGTRLATRLTRLATHVYCCPC